MGEDSGTADMDVADTRLHREIESRDRLMREREQDHSRELQRLRESQKEQVKELSASQAENTRRLKEKAEEQIGDIRGNADKNNKRLVDSYERGMAEERKNFYNRFGKVESEGAIERSQDRQRAANQIDQLIGDGKRKVQQEHEVRNESAQRQKEYFDSRRSELESSYADKVASMERNRSDGNATGAAEVRKKVDDYTRTMDQRLGAEKLGADLKYKKLADEGQATREALRTAYGAREKQLVDEKAFMEQKSNASGNKTFDEYKNRTNNDIQRMNDDNRFQLAARDRENANRVASTNAYNQKKSQEQASAFRKAESEMKADLDSLKDKSSLREGLQEHRHKQELYLAQQAQSATDNEKRQMLRDGYFENLDKIEERGQQRHLETSKNAQAQLNKAQQNSAEERKELEQKMYGNRVAQDLERMREKKVIQSSYAGREQALEDLRRRQLEGQREQFIDTLQDNKKKANDFVFKEARENRQRTYSLQEMLRNQTQELQKQKEMEVLAERDNSERKANRLSSTYHRALTDQWENFEESTGALRADSMLTLTKARTDAQHEQRIQMMDLQTRNRAMAMSFEARINQLKDEYETEKVKMKSDSDKLVRDTERRSRDTIQGERAQHLREMDVKDRLMKEKLKLQEEAFKEQIEKLKRTNELALKKS